MINLFFKSLLPTSVISIIYGVYLLFTRVDEYKLIEAGEKTESSFFIVFGFLFLSIFLLHDMFYDKKNKKE